MQFEQVKELIKLFEDTTLNDMDLQFDNVRIRLNRSANTACIAPPMMPPPPNPCCPPNDAVKKPMAGPEERKESIVATDVAAQAEETADEKKYIKAPIVGTFYQSSAPDKEPLVKVGDSVCAGDVVCIIEAMKFMNEVNSDLTGTIAEILVKDGDFVEYGQELFRIQ